MSDELLKTLEEKVQNAIEIIELQKVEISDVTEENTSLKQARSEWEQKLTNLIGKFEELEGVSDSTDEGENEDTSEASNDDDSDSSNIDQDDSTENYHSKEESFSA